MVLGGLDWGFVDQETASDLEWLYAEVAAGRMTAPTSLATPAKPDLSYLPKNFDYPAFYQEAKEQRI
jgi:hypothetical protein